jgi:hypothetical protein
VISHQIIGGAIRDLEKLLLGSAQYIGPCVDLVLASVFEYPARMQRGNGRKFFIQRWFNFPIL